MSFVPCTEGRLRVVRSALPAIAILVLLGCIYGYHQEVQRISHAAAALKHDASAHTFRRDLIGQRLGNPSFAALRDDGWEGPDDGTPLLVLWIVDPGTCVNCLSDLTPWRRLTDNNPDVKKAIVLVGVSQAEAMQVMQKAGVRGDVWWDEEGSGASKFVGASPPPSLLLLLGPNRMVLAAEVGYQHGSCQREQFGQLNALVERIEKGGDRTYTARGAPKDRSLERKSQRVEVDAKSDP